MGVGIEMKNESKCRKVLRDITIMGVTFKAHNADIKICRKCRNFTPSGCNAYRRFRAEAQALKSLAP